MNDLNKAIATLTIATSIFVGGSILLRDGYTMEDADQIWTPDLPISDIRFYQKKTNHGMIVVGYDSNNKNYEARDLDELYQEKLIESRDYVQTVQ